MWPNQKNMIWPTKNACIYTEKMVSWSATHGCDKPCHQFVFFKPNHWIEGFLPNRQHLANQETLDKIGTYIIPQALGIEYQSTVSMSETFNFFLFGMLTSSSNENLDLTNKNHRLCIVTRVEAMSRWNKERGNMIQAFSVFFFRVSRSLSHRWLSPISTMHKVCPTSISSRWTGLLHLYHKPILWQLHTLKLEVLECHPPWG